MPSGILTPAVGWNGGGLTLTTRGYGWEEGDRTPGYGTVVSGSAPSAGDLVIWHGFTYDTDSIGGGGWTVLGTEYVAYNRCALLYKIITASDISSPPTLCVAGFDWAWQWHAFEPSVPISIRNTGFTSSGSDGNPSSMNLNESAEASPGVILSGHSSYDGTPTSGNTSWSGATPDTTTTAIGTQYGPGEGLTRFKLYGEEGSFGDSVTADMNDLGTNNIQLMCAIWVQAA
tara:strand:- start:37454 stop:38143 length:690 start_codon:yes stop_codon:yes gene_type:complete